MFNQKTGNEFDLPRQRMLRSDLRGRGIIDKRVLAAMAEIPREEFVPAHSRDQAYSDGPLPIAAGQTISQPFIVALMTQELKVSGDMQVLEIGTGSGYQSAILCRCAKKVYTIERHAELSTQAQVVLARLGLENIEFHIGDGSLGWPGTYLPDSGVFDRIMFTAAVPQVPQPVVEQLAEGGLIVAPVGFSSVQELMLYEKRTGVLTGNNICDVRFVKLYGRYGFQQ